MKNAERIFPERSRVITTFGLILAHSLVGDSAQAQHPGGHNYLKYHNVKKSVTEAAAQMSPTLLGTTSDRLAVLLLYSHPIEDKEYGPCLFLCFRYLKESLLPFTPADIFLFVKPQHRQGILARPWVRSMPNLVLVDLDMSDERSWKMPDFIRPEGKGWSSGFSEEYRLMGHWRLVFSFPFAKEMGYKYLLQMDTDTYILTPIKYDLVKTVKEKNAFVTNRGRFDANFSRVVGDGKSTFFLETRGYLLGLAELAKYWLITRGTVKGYKPLATADKPDNVKGNIFKHCKPENFDGLRTMDTQNSDVPGFEGWDGEMILGNFNIFSLDWWFSWEVQDFIQLVLRTGGHIEHRWVDCSTETMAMRLFCPERNMLTHLDFMVEHGHWDYVRECGKNWMSDTNQTSPATRECWKDFDDSMGFVTTTPGQEGSNVINKSTFIP